MAKAYLPPKQTGIGQFVDSIFLIVLVYGCLMLPLLFNFGGGESAAEAPAEKTEITWQSLQQNEVMQAQWEKLGYSPEEAAELINARFDYSIEPISLGVTALVILGYFLFVLKYSEKEYRDVIAERFGRTQK
ncbi:hypothetical protein A7A08_01534 [Methyloligella halotolerans]|uniref:Uncharacterized protein n=1 Tax=Methyloligella halotolerans TaxID=1177755 RepID=A0A1E2RZ64_9HYPH|nr:hypothetical protein [Methyloligella halotolerans]ODA67501.1 hypothetical protein A7A08_01534 [Methyloligella halotolerans]